MEKFFQDLLSGSFKESLLENFGTQYLLSEGSEYYSLIGHALSESKKNFYLFINKKGKILFSLKQVENKLCVLDDNQIQMLNEMLLQFGEENTIQMIETASNNREKPVFIRITSARKILQGFISPSRIRKVVLKILDKKAAEAKKTEK